MSASPTSPAALAVALVTAMAAQIPAQTLITHPLAEYYGGRTSYTSRSSIPGATGGELLTSRIGTDVARGSRLQPSIFAFGGDDGTACRARRFHLVLQDQNGSSRERYRLVLHRKSILAGPDAGDPDMSTGGAVARSSELLTPQIQRHSPVAWQLTYTLTRDYPLSCSDQMYYGVHLPANPAWTRDGLSIHGDWFVSGSQGSCPRPGAPHTTVAVLLPANKATRPSEGREHRMHHGVESPTLDVGHDVDPVQVTRCLDPSFGAGGAFPDTSLPRRDGLVFRAHAAGCNSVVYFLSAPRLTLGIRFPFLKGRMALDPLTVTTLGVAPVDRNGRSQYQPTFTAQGALPTSLAGGMAFQAAALCSGRSPRALMTNTFGTRLAFNGDVPPIVDIENVKGDLVVPVKGTKKFKYAFVGTPRGKLTLKITRKAGSRSGAAVFASTGTDERPVKSGDTACIEGVQVSDVKRNLTVDVRYNGVPINGSSRDFTVFEVEIEAIARGKITSVVHAGIRNHRGEKLNSTDKHMRKKTGGSDDLGHKHLDGNRAYGAIVFRGKIVPPGIPKGDFNQGHSRKCSFDWRRRSWWRCWDEDGCLFGRLQQRDDHTDDQTDLDEDLTANPDRTGDKHLYVWSEDVPVVGQEFAPDEGDVLRLRWQFRERLYYAGVPVSKEIWWYWRASMKRENGKFVEDRSIQGDNVVAEGKTNLTADLTPKSNDDFTLGGIDTNGGSSGQPVTLSITGTNLDFAKPCTPRVFLVREDKQATKTVAATIPMREVTSTGTKLTGKFKLEYKDALCQNQPAPPGKYSLKVFIGEHVRTLADVFTVR